MALGAARYGARNGGYSQAVLVRGRRLQQGVNVREADLEVLLEIGSDLRDDGGGRLAEVVYGTAELVQRDGQGGDRVMRITPTTSWSLNLDGSSHPGGASTVTPRKTEHAPL